jgi:hypothetical protein
LREEDDGTRAQECGSRQQDAASCRHLQEVETRSQRGTFLVPGMAFIARFNRAG